MGNCCSGGSEEGQINMMKSNNQKQLTEFILDDREVLGLRGRDKIRLVVKI